MQRIESLLIQSKIRHHTIDHTAGTGCIRFEAVREGKVKAQQLTKQNIHGRTVKIRYPRINL